MTPLRVTFQNLLSSKYASNSAKTRVMSPSIICNDCVVFRERALEINLQATLTRTLPRPWPLQTVPQLCMHQLSLHAHASPQTFLQDEIVRERARSVRARPRSKRAAQATHFGRYGR